MSEPKKITEKYLAGFVDADGTFGIRFVRQNGVFISRMFLGVCQETEKDKVIYLIAESFGGTPYVRVGGQFKKENTAVEYSAKQARMILSRIAKYLVCKRHFADFCIDYALTHRGRTYTADEVEAEKTLIANARAVRSYPLPNYPSRQWLAGYFDGDGCIASKAHQGKSWVCGVLAARVEDGRREGQELLLKAFGGAIYESKEKASSVWVVNLDPSKAKTFLGHFAKHSIVKRSQVYYALGCAEGGNYRDGEAIHRSLQLLKAQQQRLSDPEVNVSFLLKKVRFDVPKNAPTLKRQSTGEAA